MRAKDPIEFLMMSNSQPIGNVITGTIDGVAWQIEPRVSGFTSFFIVKVGYHVRAALSMKAAQRERDVLVETFAPRLSA